jgi:TrmH family RNA methyltransferase
MILTSRNNESVRLVRSLRDKKHRTETNLFVLEGKKFVRDAMQSGHVPQRIFQSERSAEQKLFTEDAIVVSDDLLQYMSETKTPQGVLALFEMPQADFQTFRERSRILYLEHVQDADNVGALIRSAVCAGYDGVMLDSNCADCYGGKAVRAAAGSIFNIAVLRDANLDQVVTMRKQGFFVLGSHLDGDESFDETMLKKWILIIGNEGQGMSAESTAICDALVRIPIRGNCESLNAAVAGALLMYKTMGYYGKALS